MKFPWTRRAEERIAKAERHADVAERDLRKIRGQWPKARAVAGQAHEQASANGWTETVRTIFGGASQ